MNNNHDDLLSEKDINSIKYDIYKSHVQDLQDKENFVLSLPYNEEIPR